MMPMVLIPSKALGRSGKRSRPPLTMSSLVPPSLMLIFLNTLVSKAADMDSTAWRAVSAEAAAGARRGLRPDAPVNALAVVGWWDVVVVGWVC